MAAPLFVALAFGALSANADNPYLDIGPGTGGGGGVIVCDVVNGKPKSVKLIDLEESVFYDKTVLSRKLAKLSWEHQVKAAVNRIAFADPQLHAMIWERVQTVKREFEHAMDETKDTDVVFPAPQDLSRGRVPPLKLGCSVAGLAVFNDGNPAGTRLKISHFLWKKLTPMHQAALILHESIYLMHRDIHRNLEKKEMPDSSSTRALVGFLFSDDLEKNSTTKEERERFKKLEAYRGYYLPLGEVDPKESFRNRVQKFVKPLTPYFLMGRERPLFLATKKCSASKKSGGGEFVVQVTDDVPAEDALDNRCVAEAVVKKGIGLSGATPLTLIKQEGKSKFYSYVRHPDSLLEDVNLTCRSANPLRRYNPGFKVFCGDEEIARIESSDRKEVTGLSIKGKWDFQNTFLRDFTFE